MDWGKMGSTSSKGDLIYQISKLLEQQGTVVKQRTIEDFLKTIAAASPWFLTGGGLNIPDWEQVKRDLQKRLQKKGANSFSISTFLLWCLVRHTLLTDKVKIRQEVAMAKEILEEIHEETCRSIGSVEELHRDRKEESGVPRGNFGIWCRTKANTKVCTLLGAKKDSNNL